MADDTDSRRDLVVIGASAGGVETLRRVVSGLPADLPAAVCVVLHLAPSSPSSLARILQRAGSLSCRQAVDGESLRHGEILVAPPDHHLVIEDYRVRLTSGPRENGHRPAVDALFRSAADERGGRVVGVVLSGSQDDGTAGLATIKAHGGLTIVQDPDEAMYDGMPASAIAHVVVDTVVPSGDIASAIAAMVSTDDPPPSKAASPQEDTITDDRLMSVCPECGGIMTEELEAGMWQWHCQVGHRYSPEGLADAQAETTEAAIWAAIRALLDRAALHQRMAKQAESRSQPRLVGNFRRRARDAHEQAEAIRTALRRASASTLRALDADHAPQASASDHGN
jgi:two-component system, chemotaxis family, protein-glutamate methylesterase/glutaminase